MPSFGVNNRHPYSLDDTYRRYLPITLHFTRRGSYDLNHGNVLKTCQPTLLFMISFAFICCTFTSWSFIFSYLLYNKSNIYNDYYLYYINYSCIITARLSFLFLWTTIFPILPPTKSLIQKCKNISIAFVIIIMAISIGIYLTYSWYNILNQDIQNGGSNLILINNFNINHSDSHSYKSQICNKIITCGLTDALSFYALFIQFVLILLIIVTYFVEKHQSVSFRQRLNAERSYTQRKSISRSKRRKKSRKRRKSQKKAAILLLETHTDEDEYKSDHSDEDDTTEIALKDSIEYEERYLIFYDEYDKDEFDMNSPSSFKTIKCKIFKLQILCFCILLLLWIIRYIFAILHVNFMQKYFLLIYMLFMIIMCGTKRILKSYARKLDGYRAGNVNTSFEYLFEFYCAAMYWILFRQFIVYYCDNIVYFVIVLSIHLLRELFLFFFRISDWYFDNTNDLLHEFQQRQERFYVWFYAKYNDDSNIYQWRSRLSFDFVIRINICLTTAVMQQIYLLLKIPNIYSINVFHGDFLNESMCIKATIYNVSAVFTEIVFYLIIMILVYKWYWINIWQSFENMFQQTMGKKIIFAYWMICIVSLY